MLRRIVLCCALLFAHAFCAVALTGQESARDLTITLEGEPRLDLARAVVTRWTGQQRRDIPAEELHVDGRTLTLRRGCMEGASFVIATEEAFAVTRAVSGDCREPLRAIALPRAEGVVRLRWNGRTAPKAGTIVARGCTASDRAATPVAEIPFAIDADGKAAFLLPAGCAMPLLAVDRYAPVELGTVRVAARQRHDLGTRELEEGASLLVRAVSRDDGRPLANATVLAFSPAVLQNARADEISPHTAKARAVTNAEGWARMTIPAGEVIVGVLRGNSRLPWFGDKYRADIGRELIIDPLEVPRPGSLTLRVELAPELAEAGVRVLHVGLQPGSDQRWPARALLGAAPRDGTAVFDDVPPGKWLAFASIRMRTDPPLSTARVPVEVPDGFPIEAHLPITGLLFRGRIVEPAANLGREILLSPYARSAQQVNTMLDDHHRFVVLLGEPGLYAVSLRLDRNETSVPRVAFDDPAREVEIHLPNGAISGRVVSNEGRGVTGAVVRATLIDVPSEGKPTQIDVSATTGAAGAFRFARMAAGTWTLHARTRSAESERVATELAEGAVAGDVVLRLDERKTATARLIHESGAPAAGAKVMISAPPARPGDYGPSLILLADAQGRISFSASPEYRNNVLRFSVTAADGTAAAFRRELSEDLTLVLPAIAGQLVITTSEGEWPPTRSEMWLVAEDGSILGMRVGRVMATDDGRRSRFVVPRIAPGVWRLVAPTSPAELHQVLIGNGNAVPQLGVARVPPGGSGEMIIRAGTKGGTR